MRVMKFGGTSLSSHQRLETVCGLVREATAEEPVVVVTSAPAGVTNLLQALVESPLDRHALANLEEVVSGLLVAPDGPDSQATTSFPATCTAVEYVLAEVEGILTRCWRSGLWDPALQDRVLGAGERLSANILSSHLGAVGVPSHPVDARELIRTDSTFGESTIDSAVSVEQIRRVLNNWPPGKVPVIPGFTGGDAFQRSTTLGRGTSDLTASLVGAALSARIVEIWTDVDGIHSEDPSLKPTSPILPHLDYDQARHMALGGARVLHPRSLDPLQPLAIPLQVRNTLRPEAPGTRVGPIPPTCGEYQRGRSGSKRGEGPNRASSAGRPPSVQLVLAGATGQVAQALLHQIQVGAAGIRERTGFDLRIGAALNSRRQISSSVGFEPGEIVEELGKGEETDWERILSDLASGQFQRPVFVDLTASPQVAHRYPSILEGTVPVVTANKLALSGGLADYRKLLATAEKGGVPFRYETTVGAALPILGAIRNLRRCGDGVVSVEAALSGTLAFVFARLAGGASFSGAVREAAALGFTEPDPREDLSGADVGRKLLILLREAGHALEPEDMGVESLVPPELSGLPDPYAFLESLSEFDGHWARRRANAAAQEERLIFSASFQKGRSEVGVRSLPQTHRLARPAPGENLILLTSELYSEVPLSISGPGAGPAITASGVLSDIVSSVSQAYGPAGTVQKRSGIPSEHPGPRGRRVA